MNAAQDAAEALSEGINCLTEISISSDASNAASLSQMRDALTLIRSGVSIRTTMVVYDSMIERLDEIIALLGGIDDASMENARTLARAYLAEVASQWGKNAV